MADRSDRDFPRNRHGGRGRHWPDDEGRSQRPRQRDVPYYADDTRSDRWSERTENPRFEPDYDPYPQGKEDTDDFADFPGWRGRRYGNPYGAGERHFDYDRTRHGFAGRAPGYQSYSDRDLRFRGGSDELGPHRGKGPRGYNRSDVRIEEDVNDRLTDHAGLDASEIEVSVAGGEVTLNGFVAERRDKREAEDCAEDVYGVSHVQNNLRVDPARFGPR